LFYYALLARPSVQTAEADGAGAAPFMVDRLLVNALLAAVLAHYVEIHFGIAISATRLHFFVYAALLLVLVYKLPQLRAAEAARRAEQSAYQKDGQRPLSKEKFEKSPWVGVWPWAFLLALMIGILGFEFMNYALPPDKVVQTGADLGAGDIFWQSLFLNAQRGFLDSPFIYLMIVLSWFLGVLVVLSEAVRYQDYFLSLPKLSPVKKLRNRVAAALFLLLGFAGVAQRFVGPAASGAREALGQSLGLLAAMVALAVALQLLRTPENGRFTAVAVALGGLAFSLPLGVAGSWEVAVGLGFVCLLIVYLLWDAQLRPYVVPPLALAVLSFAIGMAYAYMQAVLLREALLYLVFFQGIEPLSTLYQLFFRPAEAVNSIEQARVLEALQAGHLLTGFYGFLFGMQALAGAALARLSAGPVRVKGTAVGYGAAIVALFAGLVFIMQSNVRPVQADMVFKRARPFDEQAGQQRDPAVWNNAIAIYEQALGMAPAEDYYSLFLGRAYLERSALAESREAQAGLLRKAEEVLTNAEALNPLNTDHLANLARLNARWAAAVAEDAQHEERLALAEAYYRKALISSPQNSIIRNEYARLLFDLRRTCDGAIAVYEDSLAVDPFFVSTYFDYADVLIACAAAQADAEAQQALSRSATVILEAGLERDPERLRGWLQLGQAFQEGGQYEEAVAALARARSLSEDSGLPTWNIDYLEATLYRDMGQIERARALAEQALEGAPADAAPQIESFITDLGSE
jgi:tetratricopeptide (TPR) repeat protein